MSRPRRRPPPSPFWIWPPWTPAATCPPPGCLTPRRLRRRASPRATPTPRLSIAGLPRSPPLLHPAPPDVHLDLIPDRPPRATPPPFICNDGEAVGLVLPLPPAACTRLCCPLLLRQPRTALVAPRRRTVSRLPLKPPPSRAARCALAHTRRPPATGLCLGSPLQGAAPAGRPLHGRARARHLTRQPHARAR
nr:proline-rich receptor-like protein kinase PERK2 [Aegilops tauschii subsp. strangulata]